MMFIDVFIPLGVLGLISLMPIAAGRRYAPLAGMLWVFASLFVLPTYGLLIAIVGLVVGAVHLISWEMSKRRVVNGSR
jgi:hypothetical protein